MTNEEAKSHVYMICYERPAREGEAEFFDVIRELGPRSMRPMERTWLVITSLTATQITEQLRPHLQTPRDRLLIVQVETYYGWLPELDWEWIGEVIKDFSLGNPEV